MIVDIFNVAIYQPIYNGLVFLISIVPFADVGLAIIVLTIIVRLILFPLTHKSTKTQAQLRALEPQIKEVKEKYKNKKEEQSRKMMELYRQHGINPFSGCLLFLIQIPILLGLFWVIWKGFGNGLDTENLYSFVALPEHISTSLLGVLELTEKSFIMALLAGITQYVQLQLVMPPPQPKTASGKMSLKEEFARNMSLQMRYGLPAFVFLIAYVTFPAAVSLYWVTSNVFSIGHEVFVKRRGRRIPEDQTSKAQNDGKAGSVAEVAK